MSTIYLKETKMSVRLGVKDVEAELRKIPNVIIINNLAQDTDVDRAYIETISSTRYDKREKLSTVPTCGCGRESQGYNLGVICSYCNTEVTMNASNLQSELWMAAPEEVPGLILPKFANMLIKIMYIKRGHNGFNYLINPRAKPLRGNDAKTKKFLKLFGDIPRGMTSFINNIELILDRLESFNGYKARQVRKFYNLHKDRVFPRFLPLPSRLTLLVEDTNIYTYFDKTIDKVLESIYTVSGLSEETNMTTIESRLGSAIVSLCEYYEKVMNNAVGGKPGVFRKSLLGSRLSFSLRTIVTSIFGEHDYRYCKIPKSLATIIYFPALVGKLVKRGMTLLEAYDYIKSRTHKPDDLIVSMLYELVEESKPLMKDITGRDDCYGLVFNVTRYPGLRIGSSQTFLVKEFSDDSIEQSVLTLRASNCDFDGDFIWNNKNVLAA